MIRSKVQRNCVIAAMCSAFTIHLVFIGWIAFKYLGRAKEGS